MRKQIKLTWNSNNHLFQASSINRIENPNRSTLHTCTSENTTIRCQTQLSNLRIMGIDYTYLLFNTITLHHHLPYMQPQASHDKAPSVLRHTTKTLLALRRIKPLKKTKLGQVVYVNLVLEHNHNSVEPQPHASNFVRELNISDAAATFVVPEHNPVGRGFWVAFAAHKSVEVAVEEHLNDVEFAAGEAAMEGTAVWVGVEDLEAVVGASGEASVVLVP